MNKFKIGDKVHCFRDGENGFAFLGEVTTVTQLDEDSYEYSMTNAPMLRCSWPILIWEYEMEKVK